ncbi:GNAT family N-acetyltransferase [Niallia sp. 01092]|uniref:GNAT family N-acetyltransferase n=1 Tax=unclassified Niallia TaxID=2837522 RepID=UPI003FCF1B39
MLLRKIQPDEYHTVFQMGYKEWPKGRTYEQYVNDNKKEDAYGTRYVYVDETNYIIGSMIVLSKTIQFSDQTAPIYGLGSIVIDEKYQGNGYGTMMLNEFFSLYTKENKDAIFLLYSEINPQYYYRFQFRELLRKQQHETKSICMVRCNHEMYEKLSQLPKSQIPAYF